MLIYWEQITESNDHHFFRPTQNQDFWFSKRIQVWNSRRLYLHLQGKKNLLCKKWNTGKAQNGWYRESKSQDTASTLPDQKQGLTLESCKISFKPYNLGYILVRDLFFHTTNNLPLISSWEKLSKHSQKLSTPKIPLFSLSIE